MIFVLIYVPQEIKKIYSSWNATSGPGFQVKFQDQAISLAIPEDGVCLPNDWAIKPLAALVVSL